MRLSPRPTNNFNIQPHILKSETFLLLLEAMSSLFGMFHGGISPDRPHVVELLSPSMQRVLLPGLALHLMDAS